jgi:hypothetical protein
MQKCVSAKPDLDVLTPARVAPPVAVGGVMIVR